MGQRQPGIVTLELHFEWDAHKANANSRKHKVSFAEATEVFRDPLALSMIDTEHTDTEERWITMGRVRENRLIVVVHTWQEQDSSHAKVRIISARKATARETRQYEGGL